MRSSIHRLPLRSAVLLMAFAAGCHAGDKLDDSLGDDSAAEPPTVVSNVPLDGAVDAPVNQDASALFSEAMDPSTLTTGTFSLATGEPSEPVDGTVICADNAATFWPAQHLQVNTEYTATITTGAFSAAGVALAADYVWTFTTGETLAPGLPVNLGTAGDYAILAKSGISSVPASAITGDIGVSPAAATYITGFGLTVDASNTFSTSPQVTGKVYASDYAQPTPAHLTTAVEDMERAFTDAAGRAPDVTELGAGNIGGLTLAPGVYKWGTGLLIPTDLTLSGSPTDVWIFQIAQDLTVSSGTEVQLSGGAQAENVFWQVAGLVEIGTTAHVEGIVMTSTSLSLRTGASVHGILLAQTAVDVDDGVVTEP